MLVVRSAPLDGEPEPAVPWPIAIRPVEQVGEVVPEEPQVQGEVDRGINRLVDALCLLTSSALLNKTVRDDQQS